MCVLPNLYHLLSCLLTKHRLQGPIQYRKYTLPIHDMYLDYLYPQFTQQINIFLFVSEHLTVTLPTFSGYFEGLDI
jgi:hypothetical protein